MARLNVVDQGPAPAVAAGAQTTGASAIAGSHDTAGTVQFTTTATPAAGVQATVTFGTPINGPVFVSLDAANNAAGGNAPVANSWAVVTLDAFGRATGFTINSSAAPGASTLYQLVYTVMT